MTFNLYRSFSNTYSAMRLRFYTRVTLIQRKHSGKVLLRSSLEDLQISLVENFQNLELQECKLSVESPWVGWFVGLLVKSVSTFLKHVFCLKYPYFHITYWLVLNLNSTGIVLRWYNRTVNTYFTISRTIDFIKFMCTAFTHVENSRLT